MLTNGLQVMEASIGGICLQMVPSIGGICLQMMVSIGICLQMMASIGGICPQMVLLHGICLHALKHWWGSHTALARDMDVAAMRCLVDVQVEEMALQQHNTYKPSSGPNWEQVTCCKEEKPTLEEGHLPCHFPSKWFLGLSS